jgi:branched-chain amino acid transport system permease protein
MGQTLVVGIISGGIYGLMAVGLVLVFKGTRVLNFAQVEVGTLSLYAAYEVTEQQGAPWIVGALAAVVLALAIGLLFERYIVRPMGDAPRMTVAVATIGLLSLMLAFESVYFGPSPRILRPPIAGLGTKVLGVYVSPTQWLSLGVVVVVGVGLAAFLRRTDFGLGVLAAAEDPTAVRLVGVRLSRVSAFVWGTSAVLSAVAALLIEPTVGVIAPGALAGLFASGLAAALVGGLTSLSGAFVGGLVVGVAEAMVGHYVVSSSVPGIPSLIVFGAILAVLVARPGGLLGGKVATA